MAWQVKVCIHLHECVCVNRDGCMRACMCEHIHHRRLSSGMTVIERSTNHLHDHHCYDY